VAGLAGETARWRRGPPPAAVLVLCAAGALTLGVAAQEGEGAVPVFERPRPDYDAKGIDLGGFRLYPGAAVTESYDDNIFADDSDTEADLITTVAASLVMESEWARHQLTVEGRVRHQKFLDNDDQNRTEFLIRPSLRLDLPERSQANLSAEYSRRVIGRDDPEDSGDREPTEYDRFETRAEIVARANRTFFGLDGQVRRDDYLASSDSDRDRTEFRVGVPLGYEVSAKTDVTLEPFFRWRDFDEVDSSGADRDARAAGATVGIDTELTSMVHLDFDIGFIANDFEDPRFDDSVDLIFGGEIVWYAAALTTAKARAARHDISTSQTGASSKTQTNVDLEVQHEVRHNVLLGAEISYINDDFRDIDRNDDRGIVGLSAQYLINNYASLVANYRYEQRWSDADNEDFSRNIVTLGLRTRF
jgi:hypothetical protein